jgi:hypothetical protein
LNAGNNTVVMLNSTAVNVSIGVGSTSLSINLINATSKNTTIVLTIINLTNPNSTKVPSSLGVTSLYNGYRIETNTNGIVMAAATTAMFAQATILSYSPMNG